MYKLFLCLTYLHRKVMPYFAMLAVALCVAMLLIATSVFDGFLYKIENAAKGLFGDIVISAPDLDGMMFYDEFIAELETMEEVHAATPYIRTYGILRVRDRDRANERLNVQVAGIRLPQRAAATDFEQGLFVQAGQSDPTFDPPLSKIIARLKAEDADLLREVVTPTQEKIKDLIAQLTGASAGDKPAVEARLEKAERLLGNLAYVKLKRDAAIVRLGGAIAAGAQGELLTLQKQIDAIVPKGADESTLSQGAADSLADLRDRLRQVERQSHLLGPDSRVILGRGLPTLSRRTPQGRVYRIFGPGDRVVLSIVPLGERISADFTLADRAFTIVDECNTGVVTLDSNTVYIPFETLQVLNNMQARYDADDPTKIAVPARCEHIHVKIVDAHVEGQKLIDVRDKIDKAWTDFCRRKIGEYRARGEVFPFARWANVGCQTWRQQQAAMTGPIESQRTLVVIMFGLISLVSIVLIFVIFYTIVVQHTRDIGVIKSLGGSGPGVAAIFLGYGSVIGAIGSVLGVIIGTYFVHYINEIHDWVGETFGFRVWSADVFMFDTIPNEVSLRTTIMIVIWAIVGGLLGALIPAVRAARMQPVEALRYE